MTKRKINSYKKDLEDQIDQLETARTILISALNDLPVIASELHNVGKGTAMARYAADLTWNASGELEEIIDQFNDATTRANNILRKAVKSLS